MSFRERVDAGLTGVKPQISARGPIIAKEGYSGDMSRSRSPRPLAAAINDDLGRTERDERDSVFASLCERESRRKTIEDQNEEKVKELQRKLREMEQRCA